MRNLFTILLACIAFLSFAQRSEVLEYKNIRVQESRALLDNDTTLLMPGNSGADGITFHQFWFGPDDGYLFGTNTYNDMAYGQEYVVDEPYNIAGAIFWFAAHAGSTGHVIFRVWDMADGTPGDVLYEQSVAMDDLWGTTSLSEAYTIFFEDDTGNPTSIPVSENYLIGVDISNLDDYEYDADQPEGEELIYGLGNVSTDLNTNQGGGNFLVWIMEEDGSWVNVENYGADGWDADVMILVYALPYDDDNGDDPGETYSVTFNVDMTDVEGFDHEIHKVFLTGSFTDWAVPGTDESIEMDLVVPDKSEDLVVFEEDFGPAIESPDLPDGWLLMKADNALGNNLQELEEDDQRWIRYSELYYPYEEFNPDWVHSGEAAMHCNWNVQAVQNAYAISPAFDIPEAESVSLEFWKYFVHNVGNEWVTHFNVLIEIDGNWILLQEFTEDDGDNMYDEPVLIDLSDYQGTARLAWVLKWTDGIQMTIDSITVTAVGVDDNGDDPEELIYTVTLDIEEGTISYKYFSDLLGDGFDGGEWEGDPNREAEVTEDMVINDVFGIHDDDDTSIVDAELNESILNLFPNPATTNITVSSDLMMHEVKVYDITGRMVLQLDVNGHEQTLDVSTMRGGIYIMQVYTEQGVEGRRFHVAR